MWHGVTSCHPHRHRAVNLFLQSYCSLWLMNTEHANHDMLTEELLVSACLAVSSFYIKSPANCFHRITRITCTLWRGRREREKGEDGSAPRCRGMILSPSS